MTHRFGLTIFGCAQDEEKLFRERAPQAGVVPIITGEPVSEATVELARGSRCVSVGHKTAVTRTTLLALRAAGVEYLSTRSVGDNHIDVEYAERAGITVGTVSYSPDSVADFTLMLMLMCVRNARTMLRRAEAGDYRLHEVRGQELRDLTIGVVGTGRIGTAVLKRLPGFGGRVLAHDTHLRTTATYVPLDELLRQSDVVTLHTPLTESTRHLLDRRRLGRMKPGAFLVNTGRGGLVDTEALIAALESGALGGAALDVVEGEEGIFYRGAQAAEHKALARLRELPNVIISPHTAYYTEHSLRDTVENTLLNCVEFESRKHHG